MPNSDYHNAILGCLFGGAIGDALGLEVEFKSLSSIHERYGLTGITEPALTNGKSLVSDDTQMTMFTLDGVLSHLESPASGLIEEVRKSYLRWLTTQERDLYWTAPDEPLRLEEEPVLNHMRAPGRTCCNSLEEGGHGTLENPLNNSKGCGGVMRVAPVGLVQKWSPKECFHFGAQTAVITHGHPSGYLSAGALALIIRVILGGSSIIEASQNALSELANWPDHEETATAIDQAITLSDTSRTPSPKDIEKLGEGWVGEEALAIGLFSALVATSFSEAIILAANHSGDSDSTASIAGQIYGAKNQVAGIPENWIKQLDVYDPFSRLIDAFIFNQPS